ncbi:DUF72 domain-containing protein [bacterium]|nr:DUF72 domain-containing protein [bacterium]
MAGRCRIGTSGWAYPHWRGPFYPRELAPGAWLDYYARHFDTVEINRSFYRLPTPEAAAAWAAAVPEDFCFAVKASRYLTHLKKLKDPAPALSRLFAAIAPLGDKLGPVLYQLPPRWRFDAERLAGFLGALPQGLAAVEFRDPSWYRPEAYRLLADHGVALCASSFPGLPMVWEATGGIGYVRLHGTAVPYGDRYTPNALGVIAQRVRNLLRRGLDVYVYFDNDAEAFAVENARELRKLLE